MKLQSTAADIFIPDAVPEAEALSRITHLGIGAHQDDLEFMAFHGIVECFHHCECRWFAGVTCTDGSGSARAGAYADYSDAMLREVRMREQRAAATVGRYGAMFQLGYPSETLRLPADHRLAEDLRETLETTKPQVVYTHSLLDKHDTHVSVVLATLRAIRGLPKNLRPGRLLGCEMWRSLDWLCDAEKVTLDVSGHDSLAGALNGIFDSQITGGKRYDLAVLGRRSANATFFESHIGDSATQLSFAQDLTPLIEDDTLDPVAFALDAIDRFREDVRARIIAKLGSRS